MRAVVIIAMLGLAGCEQDTIIARSTAVNECMDRAVKVDQAFRDKALDVCKSLAESH